jgi:hypothetical protein
MKVGNFYTVNTQTMYRPICVYVYVYLLLKFWSVSKIWSHRQEGYISFKT